MSAPFRMSEAERLALDRDGYVLREGVFDGEECERVARECEAVVARVSAAKERTKLRVGGYMIEFEREFGIVVKWEPEAPDLVMGIEPVARVSEPLAALGRDPRLMDPCKDVVGDDDIDLFTEKLNMKRARKGGSIWLHQDYPYWADVAPIAARVATAMVFLDDADPSRGCLEVAPGSHRDGDQKRREASDFGSREMDPATFDIGRLIPLTVKRGAVAFFGPFLVHRSLPNRSDDDRRALLYSYQPAGHPHLSQLAGRDTRRVTEAR